MQQLNESIEETEVRNIVACEVYHSFFTRNAVLGEKDDKDYVNLHNQRGALTREIFNATYLVLKHLQIDPEQSVTIDELFAKESENTAEPLCILRELNGQLETFKEKLWEASKNVSLCELYLEKVFLGSVHETVSLRSSRQLSLD